MKFWRCLFFGLALCGATVLSAHAQLEVDLKIDSTSYMKFEPIMAHVKISNFTGHTIGLFNHHDKPWLTFYVSRLNGQQVGDLGVEYELQQVQVPGGDSITIHVNLTPVYNIRAPGIYRVMAIVYSASYGREYKSGVCQFDLVSGRTLWQETVAVIPTNAPEIMATIDTNTIPVEPPKEHLRTYELVAKRVGKSEELYAIVKDEPNNIVHGVVQLGILVGFAKPTTMIDRASHLHVLHQVGSRAFAYAEVGPDGKVVEKRIYSNLLSTPKLSVSDRGIVSVVGGEQTYPSTRVRPLPDDEDLPVADTPQAK